VKHTPGPWKAGNDSGCRPIKAGKSGRHRQAQYMEIANTVGLSDDAEDRANARLIAAAPDLLAALKRALPWIREGLEFQSIEPQARADLAAAESALAKAEGPTTPEVSDER
jgi:hypothetical protein